jgi:hypothetical protein
VSRWLAAQIAALTPYLHYQCQEIDSLSNSLFDSGSAKRNMAVYQSYIDLCYQNLGPYSAHRFKNVISGTTPSEPGAFPAELREKLTTDPLHNVEDITLTFLIRFNETPVGVYRFWSCDGDGENLATNILTAAWFQDAGSGWQFYTFHEYGTSGTNVSGIFGPVFAVGQTYHVVFRRVMSTKTWSLFVDGVKYDQVYSETPEKHSTPGSNTQWAKFGGSSAGTTEIEMDDSAFAQFALWNSALTDEEVAGLYTAWQSDIQSVSLRKIAGVTRLDGNIAQATLRLYDAATGAFRAEVLSDPATGEYTFEGESSGYAGDEDWDYVAAYLKLEGAQDSAYFPDEAGKASAAAYVDDTASYPEVKIVGGGPFGNGALALPGTDRGCLAIGESSMPEICTQDFTLEFFVRPTNGGHGDAYARLAQIGPNGVAYGPLAIVRVSTTNPLRLMVQGRSSSSWFNLIDPTTESLPNDTWSHVALERDSAGWRLYFDGVLVASSTSNVDYCVYWDPLVFGGNLGGSENFLGQMGHVRLTVGKVRYGANFDKPTAPFPVGPLVSVDPIMAPDETFFVLADYGSGVRPLAHGPISPIDVTELWTPSEITTALWLDAADESTLFLESLAVSQWNDKSGNGRHFSQAESTKQPAYAGTIDGKTVLAFDGSDDQLNAASPVLGVTHSLFIVFNPTNESVAGVLFGQWASGATGRYLLATNQDCQGLVSNGRLNPFNASTTDGGCTSESAAGLMSDIAMPAEAQIFESISTTGPENWKVYRNGTLEASGTVTALYTGVNSALGSLSAATPGNFYDGQIAEAVVLSSVASEVERQRIEGYLAHKWGLAAKLPGDHPYKDVPPYVTEETGDQYWGDVLLLAGFDTAVSDESSYLRGLTVPGTAALSDAQSAFGGQSLLTGSSGSGVSVPNSTDFAFAGDFTIEGWVYPTGAGVLLLSCQATTNKFVLYADNASSCRLLVNGSNLLTGIGLTANAWQHVAICRASGTLRVFVGGAIAASVANANELVGSTNLMIAGSYGTAAHTFNGYTDEVRVTALARYTEIFDPPTAAFFRS